MKERERVCLKHRICRIVEIEKMCREINKKKLYETKKRALFVDSNII
jgi:hypothetical protein